MDNCPVCRSECHIKSVTDKAYSPVSDLWIWFEKAHRIAIEQSGEMFMLKHDCEQNIKQILAQRGKIKEQDKEIERLKEVISKLSHLFVGMREDPFTATQSYGYIKEAERILKEHYNFKNESTPAKEG